MAGRLTLSSVGIKSPLDVAAQEGEPDDTSGTTVAAATRNGQREQKAPAESTEPETPGAGEPARRGTTKRTRRASRPSTENVANGSGGGAPFYGSGRPLQTSIALDEDCAQLLEQVARAARISVNALVVAALQAGLPPQSDVARDAIVDERVRRAGITPARIEHNLRLPEHLRVRIDELTAAARERLPRVARADLVNAALRAGLPADPQEAAQLVSEHARRLERAAAA